MGRHQGAGQRKEGPLSGQSGYCARSRRSLVTEGDIPVALTAFGGPNDIE